MSSTPPCLELKNRFTGETLRMRRIRDADGRIILTIDGSLPPGSDGPPLHIHLNLREEGIVKSGTLGAQVGNKTITIPTGATGIFDAGVPHKWNAGNDLLELSGRAIPADDLDRYLQALFAIVNASNSSKPSIFYLAHVLWRYRHAHVLVTPPPFVQRIVFPVIVFIGRILGKYRGDNWPGSPASSPGAPEAP